MQQQGQQPRPRKREWAVEIIYQHHIHSQMRKCFLWGERNDATKYKIAVNGDNFAKHNQHHQRYQRRRAHVPLHFSSDTKIITTNNNNATIKFQNTKMNKNIYGAQPHRVRNLKDWSVEVVCLLKGEGLSGRIFRISFCFWQKMKNYECFDKGTLYLEGG